jgi:cob(I)alamin adenosyltransferase
MKLYTRRGDAGLTDLYGGQRVGKDHLRVEAYGTVDELNSLIGLALATGGPPEILEPLASIQSRLFEIGADLATPHGEVDKDGRETGRGGSVPRVGASQVEELECWIDAVCEPVPAMQHFILPGGTELAARLHVARTVCRRAERSGVALTHHEPIGEHVIVYLNRLSDLLFAMARRANQLAGVEDVPWLAPDKASETADERG